MEVIMNINDIEYKNIFKKISMYIEKNTITTISGPNNCGKTTLIRVLSRDINANGSIIINGKSIDQYSDKQYYDMLQTVILDDFVFTEKNVIEELKIKDDKISNQKLSFIMNSLMLDKIKNKKISELTDKENFSLKIASSIISSKEFVLIDSIDQYYNDSEIDDLYIFFHKCIEKYNLTFIITCINLSFSIQSDYLYIISDGKILLHGEPLQVLTKDNDLNKIGLEVPFMIDLSVKLRDYDLINTITTSEENLINTLWN